MSQLVKTKRQANFKNFKRFGVFKTLVEQKNVVFNSFVCKLAHSCQKRPNLHTNELNKLLLSNERPKHFTETGRGVLSFFARLLDDNA
jgi:hypothetical protein